VETNSLKVPVVNRQDYTMYLENFAGMLWFHTDVRKWSSEVKKSFIKDLDTLQTLVSVPLVALIDNTKLAKFARSIGFKYEQPIIGNDNEKHEIYSRSL
jgi:hypothetical protein